MIFVYLLFSKQAAGLPFLVKSSYGTQKHPNKAIYHAGMTWCIHIWNLLKILNLMVPHLTLNLTKSVPKTKIYYLEGGYIGRFFW